VWNLTKGAVLMKFNDDRDKLEGKFIQPRDLFALHSISNEKEANKVINSAYSMLSYLRVGDVLETSANTFRKIAEDLIQIESPKDFQGVVDNLETSRIIRIAL
jgi:hypothetical protein